MESTLPDLTPMDYFFWGVLKEKVYRRAQTTLLELRDAVSHEFEIMGADISPCKKVCASVYHCMEKCIECNGQTYENLL